MKYYEILHFKPEIIKIIFESFLSGYSYEEIYWRLNILDIDISFEDIDPIIDYVIQANY